VQQLGVPILSAAGQAGGDDGGLYAHAKQFNRHHREVRFLRTRLGRLIRDIRRKIKGHGLSLPNTLSALA